MLLIESKEQFFSLMDEWQSRKPQLKQENTNSDTYLSQRQAAKLLHVTPATIISWKKKGLVKYYQRNRTILFKKSELLESMRSKSIQEAQNEY